MAKAGFAIIGVGVRAELHAQVIESLPDCALVAVCSRSIDKAKEFSSRHSFCKVYDEVEYLLDDENVDIVVITTPSGLHFHPASLAINSGRHVIVECPLEISSEKALSLYQAAEDEGVYLECIFSDRFSSSSCALHNAISEGILGKILSFDYKIKDKNTDVYLQASPWRENPLLSGGRIFLPSNIQALDKLLFILAEEVRLLNDTDPFDVETTSGIPGTISIRKDNPDTLSIICEKGSVRIRGNVIEEWNITNREKPKVCEGDSELECVKKQYSELMKAFKKGCPVCVDALMAESTIKLCEKIHKNLIIR